MAAPRRAHALWSRLPRFPRDDFDDRDFTRSGGSVCRAVARALVREANSIFYARPGQAPAGSLREAVLARAAAPAFGLSAERAYAAGLLHDVGKLVLLDRAAALAEERSATAVPWPALRAALVALHEPLGGLAVVHWGMGVEAASAIAAHHRAPPPEPRNAMSEVIYLAERVDHAVTRGDVLDLDATWAEAALDGVLPRAAAALARHLGPMTPFEVAGVESDHSPSRLSRLAGR